MSELSSRLLSKFVYEYHFDSKDVQLEKSVRERIYDYLVSAIAGERVNGFYNKAMLDVIDELGGNKDASILFSNDKTSTTNAAMMNATYGHGADLDDGHKTANGHPGVATIPAILALAEQYKSSKEQVYEAIICAYEVYIRLSNAVQPSLLHRGFHGTGVVGAVAAAAGCAKLIGLDEQGIHTAISLGATSASGLFEVSETGQMSKPINPANACRTGIVSALLAKKKVLAPENPFEGVKGFFKGFADTINVEAISEGLGEKIMLDTAYVKLYPACRHTHPSIDAGHNIREKRTIKTNEVKKIIINTYHNAILVTGSIAYPKSIDEAKFSMRYALARSLLTGNYTLDDLDTNKCLTEETKDLISKMEIKSDEKYENKKEKIRGAMVEVLFTDGTSIQEYIPLPNGDPDYHSLQPDDFRRKLSAFASGYLSEEKQEALYNYFFNTNNFDIETIYSFMR